MVSGRRCRNSSPLQLQGIQIPHPAPLRIRRPPSSQRQSAGTADRHRRMSVGDSSCSGRALPLVTARRGAIQRRLSEVSRAEGPKHHNQHPSPVRLLSSALPQQGTRSREALCGWPHGCLTLKGDCAAVSEVKAGADAADAGSSAGTWRDAPVSATTCAGACNALPR